jgi:hypothetical protein
MRIMVMFGAVLGVLCLVAVFFVAGAPQQAALAAMACAVAIIPYVGWRASQIDDEASESRKFRADVLALLKDRPPTP